MLRSQTLMSRHGREVMHTFAILLIFTHVGVGGGGVSGLGEISSSGATSGLSANILSKSICFERNKEANKWAFVLWVKLSKKLQCIIIFLDYQTNKIIISIPSLSPQTLTMDVRLHNGASPLFLSCLHFLSTPLWRSHCHHSVRWPLPGEFVLWEHQKQVGAQMIVAWEFWRWATKGKKKVLLRNYNIKMSHDCSLGVRSSDHEESRPGRHLSHGGGWDNRGRQKKSVHPLTRDCVKSWHSVQTFKKLD